MGVAPVHQLKKLGRHLGPRGGGGGGTGVWFLCDSPRDLWIKDLRARARRAGVKPNTHSIVVHAR